MTRYSGKRYSRYKVGDGVLLTLMQVAPGHEKKVAQKLSGDFSESIVCKIFGDFDFCLVQKSKSNPATPSLGDDYRQYGVSNIHNINMFGWKGLDNLEKSTLNNYPALCFCFFKLNREFLQAEGINGEQDVLNAMASMINRAKLGIEVGLFGTLGWFEVVAAISSKEMSNILQFAERMRHAVIKQSDNKIIPCFETTTMIPAIVCKNDGSPLSAALGTNVELEVRISCHSWADQSVIKSLKKKLGAPLNVVGTDDFTVRDLRQKNLQKYVKALWAFRNETSNNVYKTRTSFVWTATHAETPPYKISPPTPERIKYDSAHPKLKELGVTSWTVHQLLVETLAKLNDILMSVQKNSSVRDLLPFANKLIQEISNVSGSSKVDYIKNPRVLAQQLEMLIFGIRQRCIGADAYEAEWISERSYVGSAIGIQRVLEAVNSLIYTTLKRANNTKWEGFSVFGFAQTYHRYLSGVINMPAETIYRPDLWFGVFHEIGHEYHTQIDLLDNDRLRNSLGSPFQQKLNEISEIYAEIFGCIFGFKSDIEEYMKSTWKYLGGLSETPERLKSLLLRFLMMYIFMIERKKDTYISSLVEIRQAAVETLKILKPYVPSIDKINQDEIENLCVRAKDFRTTLDILKDLMPTLTYDKRRVPKYKQIKDGAIFTLVKDPIMFVQDVLFGLKMLTYQSSIAIILSLWDYQMKNRLK